VHLRHIERFCSTNFFFSFSCTYVRRIYLKDNIDYTISRYYFNFNILFECFSLSIEGFSLFWKWVFLCNSHSLYKRYRNYDWGLNGHEWQHVLYSKIKVWQRKVSVTSVRQEYFGKHDANLNSMLGSITTVTKQLV